MLGSRTMQLPRPRMLVLGAIVALLVSIVVLALLRELAPRATVSTASGPDRAELSALSPAEEAYAAALWPIHSEVVEASAVEVSYVGIAYVSEHHDAHRLAEKALSLQDTLRRAEAKTRALPVPSSMQNLHALYLEAISLLANASGEMAKVEADGKLEHLMDAQKMSQRASEDLLKVGDVLWPGEHKPN